MDICKDHSIEFIGPRSEHIRIMGDKSTARDTMKVRGAGSAFCCAPYKPNFCKVPGTRCAHYPAVCVSPVPRQPVLQFPLSTSFNHSGQSSAAQC